MTTTRDDAVNVRNVQIQRHTDYQELSAIVDGEKIWYRFPNELEVRARGEAFLAPALFEAMVRGVPVRIEDGVRVSRKLLHSLPTLQSIFNSWNADLHIVPIVVADTDEQPPSEATICCFSGGIDSTYTYFKFREEITHLLLLEGFATGRGTQQDWPENVAARKRFAEAENKNLLAVSSNVCGFLANRKLSLLLVHGGILGGIGATLNPRRFLIPASFTYLSLMPWGSHALVDPLWSTEMAEVVHHGAEVTRTSKTAAIAKDKGLLDQLQVCWYAGGRNCGECGKCIRTALTLFLLGAEAKNLAPYRDDRTLKLLQPIGPGNVPFIEELIKLADEAGKANVARRLRGYRARYRLRQAATELAKALVGPTARRFFRRIRPHAWHESRGTLHSTRIQDD
jgi:hypothetical protein